MARPAPQRPGIIQRLGQSIARAFGSGPTAANYSLGRRNYAAAAQNRLTEGWTAVNYSANAELQVSLDILRARSRQLCRDNPYARKFLQLVATNVVGPTGIRLQARVYNEPGKPDQLANDAIEAAWARWGTQCDVSRHHTLRSLCALLIKSAARDGEVLLRIVRGKAAGNPFSLAIQALDADRIDTAYNQSAGEGRPAIRMGVEVDEWGAPVALHLRTRQVNDPYTTTRGNVERQRIPIDEVIHRFVADRPEQLRGVPWMHASMKDLNDLGGYRESAIVAARVGASKMGFFTKAQDAPEVQGAGQGQEDADGNMIMDVDAGTIETLPEGYKFEAFNPDYPTAMYESFVKATLRGISSGLGVAYHALSNDLEGVSFSSIRSGTLEERDQWADIQEWFIGAVLEPLFAEWLQNGLAFGQIMMPNGSALPATKIEKFSGHVFLGRRWEWVDPVRDIQADIMAMEAGLMSPQAIVAKWAGDYEDTLVEIAAAQAMREKLGVKPAKPGTSAPQPDPNADPNATPSGRHMKQQLATDSAAAEKRHAELMAALLASRSAAPAPAIDMGQAIINVTPKAEAPVVHVHVPEQKALDAPVVHVTVPEQRAPEAPVVNVTVQPAEVALAATLAMPARRSDSTIERDRDGNIVRTTTVETDA